MLALLAQVLTGRFFDVDPVDRGVLQPAFLCEGDLYLFSCVLAHFFALYASINSFHQLEVINTTNNEHYTWPIQTGKQPLI